MTEIKKFTKIVILAYSIVSLIFAVFLIFFLDAFLATLNMPTWQNPAHPRMFGGALLLVVIFALVVLFNKDWDWEKIKLAFGLMYLWIPINIIMELTTLTLYGSILSTEAISQFFMDVILMSTLFVLGVVAYIKQK
ncbi:MAG: hypothetical protein ACTSQ1_13715 [Promethearchaeota archaeon]